MRRAGCRKRVTAEHLLHRFMPGPAGARIATRTVRGQATAVTPASRTRGQDGSRAGKHGGRPMSRLTAPSDSFLMGCPSNRHPTDRPAGPSLSLCPGRGPWVSRRRLAHSSHVVPARHGAGYFEELSHARPSIRRRCCRRLVSLSNPPVYIYVSPYVRPCVHTQPDDFVLSLKIVQICGFYIKPTKRPKGCRQNVKNTSAKHSTRVGETSAPKSLNFHTICPFTLTKNFIGVKECGRPLRSRRVSRVMHVIADLYC